MEEIKIYDNIIFCNNWHHGDLHYSRELIKDIIKKIKSKNYILAHNKKISKESLKDIKDLEFIPFIPGIHIESEIFKIEKNDLYINIWAGLTLQKSFEKYRTPNIPFYANLNNLYDIIKVLYKNLNIKVEEKNYYIPSINYQCIDEINLEKIKKLKSTKNILFCNGNVWSGQSSNFNTNNLLSYLANKFKDYIFLCTDKSSPIDLDNILYTEDLLEIPGPDLIEISYISSFCDVIIGRGSGPYCFCITKENIISKKFIGIGFKEPDISWCDINKFLFVNPEDLLLYIQIENFIRRKNI